MLVFYESKTKFKTYNGKEIKTVQKQPTKGFYLTKPYEATEEQLIQYYKDLKKQLKELCEVTKLEYKKLSKINYSQLHATLFKICKGDKHVKYDTIEYYEYEFLEGCFNGGLNSCVKGNYNNVKAYDFKKFYANILAGDNTTKEIPIKKGILKTIEALPEKLEYGIYRVKITSYSENIFKLFAFNEQNYYTHTDIKFMRELSFSKNFDININLIQDNEPNALIYNELIETKTIFIRYVKKLKEILTKYPDNKLCKTLLSGIWGKLSQKGAPIILTEEEYDDLENQDDYLLLDVKTELQNLEFIQKYKLIHKNRIQLSNYRLKTFLTSFGRVKMASKIKYKVNNVIRVCTDGVLFDSSINLKKLETNLKKLETKEFIKDSKYYNKNITIITTNNITIN